MPTPVPPSYADVEAAAAVLQGRAHRTPVLRSRRLDELAGCEVHLKAEHLQRVGAFKFRGALTALSAFDERQRRGGVIAFSSGNHAQAIALAAAEIGIRAVIVMPHDAPALKVAATQGYGAEVVRYDRYTQDREQIAAELAADQGMTVVPPYDHPQVIAGQGTVVKELLEDAGPLDVVVTPLGGGGLLSGSILSARALAPHARVYAVEPAAGDDGRQSLRQGRIVTIDTPRTLADGAQTTHLGQLTFPIIAEGVTDIVTATDDQLVETMRVMAGVLKQVVEPTGVLALAAVLSGAVPDTAGRRVGVVLSGGNIDLTRFAELVGAP
ncbi:threo-3-hydroxy-L-aspartate ammonia-lyase [Ornithinimicrobium cryptoxanthini]|uniref:Threo-3-hydroxy-L-aspartate ammonia-lyase n=1 Tax=Ornithinimicrobium cryptoxanthini TaxID=2934161 RepID=A0ABY4YKK0_9MICO|nr:threo-3-hydroxy-L-aspartate ammonia-lyase [Ornithinimicrobium cryptoxanthini]USQ77259.1 threo-3-hydroxy-L-aspartate ammonia-lyase [Ornithinimicrobium cryptoxanthini]